MKVLLQKAITFTGTQMKPFTYLYRCKPKIYWDYIFNETGQIMHVYQKDSNGQAACPINQNIHGLFFSARTNPDGSLPNSSPFGDVRMVIPAMSLLDPQRLNLYFSDFYCNRVTHYVTVVVAVRDTAVDNFCKEKLLLLDPNNNPFLQFQPLPNPQMPMLFFVNKKVWVEIYYTENIPMRWGKFDNIFAAGLGTSKIGGLPHNKACRICNLYPVGAPPAPQPPEDFEPLLEEKAERMVSEAAKAELIDLVDSEDENADEFDNDPQKENSFGSYEELKARLEQLDGAILTELNKGQQTNDPTNAELNGLAQSIRLFMEEMKSDFKSLDARIGGLHEGGMFAPVNPIQTQVMERTVSRNSGAIDGELPEERRARVRSIPTAAEDADVIEVEVVDHKRQRLMNPS